MDREDSVKADEERRQREMLEIARSEGKKRLREHVKIMKANLTESTEKYRRGEISKESWLNRRKDVSTRVQEIDREIGLSREEKEILE